MKPPKNKKNSDVYSKKSLKTLFNFIWVPVGYIFYPPPNISISGVDLGNPWGDFVHIAHTQPLGGVDGPFDLLFDLSVYVSARIALFILILLISGKQCQIARPLLLQNKMCGFGIGYHMPWKTSTPPVDCQPSLIWVISGKPCQIARPLLLYKTKWFQGGICPAIFQLDQVKNG